MALQGRFRLDLARKGQVVKRIEKKNTITGYPDDLMCEGNYGLLIPRDKLLPVKQFFDGCILTDHVNDASGNIIHHESNITACAGNDAYSGTYLKRGSFSQESTVISSANGYKGFRFVWDWGTDRGNENGGVISSVCLTRHQLAISEYFNDATVPASGSEVAEILYESGWSLDNRYLGRLHIIDYEREVGYRISYADNTIYIDKYQLSCKNLHLLTRPILPDPTQTYHPEYVGTEEIPQQVANMTEATCSISYTGDKIYIITWSGSAIKAYPINISDWSMGAVVEKTFNSVTFMDIPNTSYTPIYHKDIILLDGTDAWCMVTTGGVVKMVKIDLLGGTSDVKVEKTLPFTANTNYNGCCMLMPNGDFYKYAARGVEMPTCLYYHNGNFYRARVQDTFNKGNNGCLMASANSNVYGSSLYCFADESYNYNGGFILGSVHGFLSTIANLDEAVIKTADLTMKLSYEITESSGS